MARYILKRILLMIPTMVMIAIVIFGIINLAPGNPGQATNASGSERADQNANSREGFRLFKEHYNLDKPILLNFRYRLERADVEAHLHVIASNMATPIAGEREALAVGSTAASVISNIANADVTALRAELTKPGLDAAAKEALTDKLLAMEVIELDPIRPPKPAAKEVFAAEEEVENWGLTIVPFLIQIAQGYLRLEPADGTGDGLSLSASDLKVAPDLSKPLAPLEHAGKQWIINRTITEKVRFLAVQRLSVNARRSIVVHDGEQATAEAKAANRDVLTENAEISQWTYALDASPADKAATIAKWTTWFTKAAPRFERTPMGTVVSVFTETRFYKYMGNLIVLDLGTSTRFKRPVWDVIQEHWRYSIFLSLASLFLAYFISVPLGVLAAVRHNQFADRGVGLGLFVLYSLPSFFAATLMQTYLTDANKSIFSWFPVSGFQSGDPNMQTTMQMLGDMTWHMILPLVCLTYGGLAAISRYARTGLLDVIRSDYVRTARAKGLPEWIVIMKHAVRNGLIPILTLLGFTLPALIGGSIIIEHIFAIDGMGKLMITAIQFRDYNVIMGELLIASVLTLLGILLSDISYALVDPRISLE